MRAVRERRPASAAKRTGAGNARPAAQSSLLLGTSTSASASASGIGVGAHSNRTAKSARASSSSARGGRRRPQQHQQAQAQHRRHGRSASMIIRGPLRPPRGGIVGSGGGIGASTGTHARGAPMKKVQRSSTRLASSTAGRARHLSGRGGKKVRGGILCGVGCWSCYFRWRSRSCLCFCCWCCVVGAW